ncbi:hypothetical protein BGCPKDLD_1537 [Methylorubrum suomiense]|uniref:Uncharacterized protein n=1 Tax=Methylorubrum suomiense TaxID=144191 RepID=A0ABQ4UUA0_9HYPH|nr:hypothetical protein BGCPKDLD_1537 [Methylorubrum suomiense]
MTQEDHDAIERERMERIEEYTREVGLDLTKPVGEE